MKSTMVIFSSLVSHRSSNKNNVIFSCSWKLGQNIAVLDSFISDIINCFRIYANVCYDSIVLVRPIEITIYNNTALRNRVFVKIHQKQNGNCKLCKRRFDHDETIIASGRTRRYYHKPCAERLHII
jgi:hypothetical protein